MKPPKKIEDTGFHAMLRRASLTELAQIEALELLAGRSSYAALAAKEASDRANSSRLAA